MKEFMKKYLLDFFPKKLNDINFWLLSLVAILPIVRQFVSMNYNQMNFIILCLSITIFIVKYFINLVSGKKFFKIRSYALLFLLIMLVLLFVSSFFSCNPKATWLGIYGDYHGETSVFQFAFFVVVAVLGILLDKDNIKAILYEFITVALVIIFIHLANQKYDIAFVNRNFAGYYLCTTTAISIGLLLFSKNFLEIIYLSFATLMHFIILVVNSSFGPILAIICYLVIGFVYFLIHNRKVFLRFLCVCLACITIFSIFDFVPKFAKYKCEKQTVLDQLYGTTVVALNKLGIISDKKFEQIASGKDSEGNPTGDIVIGGAVIIQGGITNGDKGYERLDMWKRCLENMREKPIFGVGTGAWWTYNPDMPYNSPHNEYLQFGASFGIPALIIYLGIFVYVLVQFRRKHKKCDNLAFVVSGAMIVYLIQAFFGILQPFTAQLLYLMLGFSIKFVEQKDIDNNLIKQKESKKIKKKEIKTK